MATRDPATRAAWCDSLRTLKPCSHGSRCAVHGHHGKTLTRFGAEQTERGRAQGRGLACQVVDVVRLVGHDRDARLLGDGPDLLLALQPLAGRFRQDLFRSTVSVREGSWVGLPIRVDSTITMIMANVSTYRDTRDHIETECLCQTS